MAGSASRKAKSPGSASSHRVISSSIVVGDIASSSHRGASASQVNRNASTVTIVGPSAAMNKPSGRIAFSLK